MGIVGIDIIKEFGTPPVRILHDLNFTIDDGEFVSISGRSGSGKSTLLYIISTLDLPSQGRVEIDGYDTAKMKSKELHRFRNTSVGFIFQFHYLLPELTALENVLLGPRNLGLLQEKQKYALELLDSFGVVQHAHKLSSLLSGGEQQRVAIARALVMNPRYIFADEPTGNLDTTNGARVMEIFRNVKREFNTTIALVTHEPEYSQMAEREIHLVDGRITEPVETLA